MKLDHTDLIVEDVPAATTFFRDVLGLDVVVEDARFAELDGNGVKILLSPEAMVPTRPAAGVILHFRVEDVEAAAARARDRGATILKDVFQTDWGWESTLIAGPEEIIFERRSSSICTGCSRSAPDSATTQPAWSHSALRKFVGMTPEPMLSH
ncbi:MAG: VOC family protein [Chloroflexia bacterium]|nr:VOC family protein [Chloroflexia bacterium]